MAEEEKVRYSDKELAEFKAIIEEKKVKAEHDLALLKETFANDRDNGTDDTSPTFKAFLKKSSALKESPTAR